MSAERKKMKNKKTLYWLLETFILLAAFILPNFTALSVTYQFPKLSSQMSLACAMITLCVIVLLYLQIKANSLWQKYWHAWKKQIPLLIFIAFSLLSCLWTTDINASIYEISLMFIAALVGVFLAVQYSPKRLLEIFQIFGALCILSSLILIIVQPQLGRLMNPQFQGAWRGIFWHRNHLGSLAAFFSTLFLLGIALNIKKPLQVILNGIFFILSTVLVIGSRSATGMIIFVLLNGFFLFALLWLKIRRHLSRKHYIFALVLGIIILILCLTNLDLIFGTLGRDTSLTGRIPLWQDLVSHVWAQKPILGYGFGALWNDQDFRNSMQLKQKWIYQVFFADNGYLDILLNTGIIGLLIFLVYLFTTGFHCVKTFLKEVNMISLFPLITFIYVVLANISYSFLFEVDQFVWMLLVISSVLAASWSEINIPASKEINPQP